MAIFLYNMLTRQREEFTPLEPPRVRIYSCGPTVYRYAHLGNMRTFLMADLLCRMLEYNGYEVFQVQNITDVGHMTDEELDTGEDKMLLAAREEGKTPQEIAAFYTEAFLRDKERLNMRHADLYPRASEHIPEMIAMIQVLLEKGYAYRTNGTIYFEVARFPGYGKLSGNRLEKLMAGIHRITPDPRKRNPHDFALWKESTPGRLLHWPSPWGEGYPGWHIECSAMSVKYLGPQFDIHTGGIDNIFPHHEDEIAQSEAANGVIPARFWMYGDHLQAESRRMAKSAGNFYILQDLIDQGYDPLAFRFLCLQASYRTKLNFTWRSLEAAQKNLVDLREVVAELKASAAPAPPPWSAAAQELQRRFREAVSDDLDTPQGVVILWETTRANLPPGEKLALLLDYDRVLGLRLADVAAAGPVELPEEVQRIIRERDAARAARDFARSDALRAQLIEMGYEVQDTREGTKVRPRIGAGTR